MSAAGEIVVGPTKVTNHDGTALLSATVVLDGPPEELWIRVPERAANPSSDPFLAAMLLPAMAAGRPLRIEGPVSPLLLRGADTIQDMFAGWDPRFRKVPVEADLIAEAAAPPGRRVGCFFSGGVDSLYTALKHRAAIEELVFIRNFDRLEFQPGMERTVLERLRSAADELGKPMSVAAFGFRTRFEPSVGWGMYHGSVLAATALAMSGGVSRMYVAGAQSFADAFPWGTHPMVDPAWSSEAVEIVHDGCETDRFGKIECLTRHPRLLRVLRVCLNRTDPRETYNCGVCEKCLRTLVALRILGVKEGLESFDHPLNPADVARMPIDRAGPARHARRMLDRLRKTGGDPELAAALEQALQRTVPPAPANPPPPAPAAAPLALRLLRMFGRWLWNRVKPPRWVRQAFRRRAD